MGPDRGSQRGQSHFLRTLRVWAENRDSPPAVAYWPRQAFRDALACAVVMAVILALALQHGLSPEQRGIALGPAGRSGACYQAARPEWSFRGLYGLRDLFPTSLEAVPVFVIPGRGGAGALGDALDRADGDRPLVQRGARGRAGLGLAVLSWIRWPPTRGTRITRSRWPRRSRRVSGSRN